MGNRKLTVMKFGGGVLSNRQDFERAAGIISARRASGERIVVVVSAVSGVTDWLLGNSGKLSPSEVARHLVELHEPLASAPFAKLCLPLEEKLASNDLDRGEFVASFGERLSAIALASVLQDRGIQARAFDAESAGIACVGVAGRASGDEVVTARNLSASVTPLLDDSVAVVTGYYGVMPDGRVSTFGRGGSDYSAGLVAACLNAGRLELWKHVDGFLSCDPRFVPLARRVKSLSYGEAQELGFFGAKILHPKTVIPLRAKRIPVIIRNVERPDGEGTVIASRESRGLELKSLAFKREVACVYVQGEWLAEFPGLASTVFGAVSSVGVSIDVIATSELNLCFTTSRGDALKAAGAVASVPGISGVSTRCDLSLVSLIGDGLVDTPNVGGRAFGALGCEGVNVELISNGASNSNLSFVVAEKDLERAVKILHKEFFEGDANA
ncbi:hypothetical protein AUJ14_00795 [Candidatus Micrarchaeota archaeon CG1_02_55_22]|nr:MAG: hypothetical protein AUJ14_00795 [Candidatus Micrarchaeota archaeon CG1_02_55_22]